MINSQKYIEHQDAVKNFVRKMNFNGAFTDINTDTKILNWIRNNISATDFNSYEDAVEEWDETKRLGLTVVEENFSFYESLEGYTPAQIGGVIGTTSPPQSTNHCPECVASFNSTMSNISNDYANSVSNAMGAYFGSGGTTGAATSAQLAASQSLFLASSVLAAEEFVNCCIAA